MPISDEFYTKAQRKLQGEHDATESANPWSKLLPQMTFQNRKFPLLAKKNISSLSTGKS